MTLDRLAERTDVTREPGLRCVECESEVRHASGCEECVQCGDSRCH